MAVEEPLYTVTCNEGAIEVREYPAMIAAEVTVKGDRAAAVKTGFRLLASYIFGENTSQQSIAMTAPVIQMPAEEETNEMSTPLIQTGSGDAWHIRFMMPRSYTLDSLPKPSEPRIKILTLPATRFAVIRFSGLAKEEDITAQTDALNIFITLQSLHVAGAPALARYNPPWTLWFMRRNEIMIPLHPAVTE